MSFHLGVVPESTLTYITLDSQVITMLALMLFQVPYVGCIVLTLIALMYCSSVVFCMADQVRFSHETPLTSCGHAYMCFDFFIPVFDFMSVQITFKGILLTTFVTNKLVSGCMHIPVSLQCIWGWKNSITVRAFDRAMVFTVMVIYFLFTVAFGSTFNARVSSFPG